MSTRKCFYEILDVSMDATSDQIKKAFYKQSLKFHPDKNKEDDAREKFQLINEAYECLSDPNERSWYDNHRQQILSGKDKLDEEEIEQESYGNIKIKAFFNEKCYNGFEDDKEGFFAVYRNLFEQIKMQEEKAYQISEEMQTEIIKYPGFGDIKTNCILVNEFYEKWRVFESYKSFKWADQYVQQEEDRYYKRQVEKENKKFRNQEKTKYIKTIKNLVEFVFQRDPRYAEYEIYLQEEKQRKYQQKKQEKEEKDKQLKDLQEQNRKIFEEEQRLVIEQENQKHKEEQEKKRQEQFLAQQELKKSAKFQCNYCDLIFETNKQQFNHNNSDKHKKKIEMLKTQGKVQGQVEGTWIDKIKEKKQQK